MLTDMIAIWMVWVMVYYAHKHYPIFRWGENDKLSIMRDQLNCQYIVSHDNILQEEDQSLFITVLHILDLLYYTGSLSLLTVALSYWAKAMMVQYL